MKSFIVCALGPSTNLHLKGVLEIYQEEYRKFEPFGIYDGNLYKRLNLSSKSLYSSHEFGTMGFVEALPLVFKAKRAIKELVSLTLERKKEGRGFNTMLYMDSPAFNIPFAKALKEANSKTKRIYYVLPQVWVRKKGHIPVIEGRFDVSTFILPFDMQFFTRSIYVGRPLPDEIYEFKTSFDMQIVLTKEEERKIIASLPGSRKSEIIRLMPTFRELSLHFKGEKVLCVPPFNLGKTHLYDDVEGFKVESNTPNLLKRVDFAFICSEAATLKAALVGTPFILAYKAKAINVFVARLFVKLRHIGFAGIFYDFVGKEPLDPEFLRDEVSVKDLLNAYNKFACKPFFAGVGFLKEYLGFSGAKDMAKILYEI